MKHFTPFYAWTILIGCCIASSVLTAQPKTIHKVDSSATAKSTSEQTGKKAEGTNLVVSNVVTIDMSRLFSSRFPSFTLSYQRYLGRHFGVSSSVGLPINHIEVYRESTGPTTGVEARLGGRVYTSDYRRSRMFFALDGWLLYNPVEARAYVKEEGKSSYRIQHLKLKRKRQMVIPSLGYQFVSVSGVSFEIQLGVASGRRGVFAENGVSYLNVSQTDFFTPPSVDQNEWGRFVDVRLGLGVGYAF